MWSSSVCVSGQAGPPQMDVADPNRSIILMHQMQMVKNWQCVCEGTPRSFDSSSLGLWLAKILPFKELLHVSEVRSVTV